MRKAENPRCGLSGARCRIIYDAVLSRDGLNSNPRGAPKLHSGSRYYPKIAPFSPHFVETTFYSSHTMMEVSQRVRLIASSEARIVRLRHASNRLAMETQSAAWGGSKDRKKLTNESRCETSAWPLGTVAGTDRWW